MIQILFVYMYPTVWRQVVQRAVCHHSCIHHALKLVSQFYENPIEPKFCRRDPVNAIKR
jgi:hypothetical protein